MSGWSIATLGDAVATPIEDVMGGLDQPQLSNLWHSAVFLLKMLFV
jgi:hypothetical protein